MKRFTTKSLVALLLCTTLLTSSLQAFATEATDTTANTTTSDSSDEIDGYYIDTTGSESTDTTANKDSSDDTGNTDSDNADSNSTVTNSITPTATSVANTTSLTTSNTTAVVPNVATENFDNENGTIDIIISNVPSSVTAVKVPTWSATNGQDDIIWYLATKQTDGTYKVTLDISNHNFDLGTYNMHVYTYTGTSSSFYGNATCSFETATAALTVTETATNSGKYTVSGTGIRISSGYTSVKYAVWSSENGQDDIKWYTATYNTTTHSWNCTVDLTNHSSYGTYYVHAYAVTTSGSQQCVKGSTFTISKPSIGDVSVVTDNDAGTFTITISGIDSDAGISSVKVPVWSTSNQSNLVWYTATKQSNDTYVVTSTINEHNNMTGTYKIHVYLYDYFGNSTVKSGGTMTFTDLDTSLSVAASTQDNSTFDIDLTGSVLQEGSTCIKYAVWSLENGQDDIKWYLGLENGYAHNEATVQMMNHSSYGTYMVHAYEYYTDGTQKLIGYTTFTVSAPTVGNVSVTTDNDTGTFTITVSDITTQTGVDKIQIPVWSTSNQSNIVWYTATKNVNGTYSVTSTLNEHNNMTGTYKIHVYLTDDCGIRSCLKSTTMSFTDVPISSSATDTSGTESTYTVNLTGTTLKEGSSYITYAVWSADGGQDDLKWYLGVENGYASNYAKVSITNHKTLGTYYVHIYEVSTDGTKKLISNTSFSVNEKPSASVSISSISSSGDFTITVSNIDALSGVSSIKVPVWVGDTQSDIYWYTATKVNSTTYSVTGNVSNHGYNFGTYTTHVYITMGNGITSIVGSASKYLYVENFLYVTKTTSGQRTVTLLNVPSSATKVQFPTWSNTSGQDDIKWYTATKQSTGTWTATIYTKNYDDYGTATIHAYVNDSAVSSTTFSVAQSEVTKTGWYYEGGYKLYYKNGVLQTDLDGILAKQSSYYIEVNRTLCTVTVYAKDGSNGYIIPVKVFACSVGLASTPTPTGTYTTSDKYRWHTLMGPSYGQYCTRITGGILFHSVAGYNMTSYNLSASAYNKLGEPASHGCVRLTVADAKWIYDYCASGTTVKIFDSSQAGPFPKPDTITIPSTQNWDPTDPAI